jgi:periplasmic protein TonB
MLFEGAFVDPPSILRRLIDGFKEAVREFRENPKAYVSSAFKGDGLGGHRRQILLRFGLAMGISVYALFFGGILILWSIQAKATGDSNKEIEVTMLNPGDLEPQEIDMPKAEKKAGGGGGGGRKTITPASKGQAPKFDLTPPIIAPRPEPQLKPPTLPVMETIQVDPRLEPPRIADLPTGDPKGTPGPPSAGPGEGGGIGSGKGGGIGSGDGTGLGPGHGFNTGGGDPSLGGGSRSNAPATSVDQRPVPLNLPRPNYTEEARKNKIQGVVRVKVLVGADGGVKQVRVTSGLPDGLNEEAIRSAYQIRFKPAMKGGQPVSYWVGVDIEFNLR